MRVRILQATWLPGQVDPIPAGTDITLPAAQAEALIAIGAAEPTDDA